MELILSKMFSGISRLASIIARDLSSFSTSSTYLNKACVFSLYSAWVRVAFISFKVSFNSSSNPKATVTLVELILPLDVDTFSIAFLISCNLDFSLAMSSCEICSQFIVPTNPIISSVLFNMLAMCSSL